MQTPTVLRILLVTLCLPLTARAAWNAWTILSSSEAYVVPALLDASVEAPIVHMNTSQGTHDTLLPPTGVRALASSSVVVMAALPRCIVRIPSEQVVAGDCASEAELRDGTPHAARFANLSQLAVVFTPQRLFWVALDGMRLVAGTPWRVVTVSSLLPDGAPPPHSISLTAVDDVVWLAMLSYSQTEVWLQRCDSCLWDPSASGWTLSVSIVDTTTSDAWACILLAQSALWMVDTQNASVWHRPLAADATATLFEYYYYDTQGGFTPRGLVHLGAEGLWMVLPSQERLYRLGDANGSVLRPASQCRPCVAGEMALGDACVPTRSGGFAVPGDFRFTPCPAGTYGPFAGATHPSACVPCPMGTIAPRPGAVACSACPYDRPLQGPLAQSCVAVCPSWTQPKNCAACPMAGYVFAQSGCAPCPANTFAVLGGPCLPCPWGMVAPPGALACSAPSSDVACFPTGVASSSPWDCTTNNPVRLYNTDTFLPEGTVHLMAAASNGTLWLAMRDIGLVWQVPNLYRVDWARTRTVLDINANITAMLLSNDESTVYYYEARTATLFHVQNEQFVSAVLRFEAAAVIVDLCMLAPSTSWLLALASDGQIYRITDAARTLWAPSALPPVKCFAPYRLGLLALFENGALGVLDPIRPSSGPMIIVREPVDPNSVRWMRIWRQGILLAEGYAMRLLPLDATDTSVWGDPGVAGDLDGIDPRFTTLVPPPTARGAEMLCIADGGRMRVLWARGCECAPGFFMSDNGACFACPEGTQSDVGATGCVSSICDVGQYLSRYAGCMQCPLTLWWRDAETSACTLLASSAVYDRPRYTLSQAQALVLGLTYMPSTIRVDPRVADAFVRAINQNHSDALLRADAMGAFWSLAFDPVVPWDPQGVSALAAPALQPPDSLRDASALLPLLGQAGPPWNTARAALFRSPVDRPQFPPFFWPARFNCTSAVHFWSYPSVLFPSGACLPCPNGTFAYDDDALVCDAYEDGGPSVCMPGAFLELRAHRTRACVACPPETYAPNAFVVGACLPKQILACAAGEFVYDDGTGVSDNACVACDACPIRVPPDANCSGRDRFQPYACLPGDPPLGYIFAFSNGRLSWTFCGALPSDGAVWAQGPRVDECYFACLWGTDAQAAYAYAQALPHSESSDDALRRGLFPWVPALGTVARQVCVAWTPPPCPEGTFRSPSEACLPLDTLPSNAVPALTGGWVCLEGWFRSHDALCLPCGALSCSVGQSYSPSRCTPTFSGCVNCPVYEGAELQADGLRGVCAYRCLPPYFQNPRAGVPCTLCGTSPPLNSSCPPGQFWNASDCACAVCGDMLSVLQGATVLAPSSDSVCRIWCRPGFHTLMRSTLRVVTDGYPQDPSKIVCESCTKRPGLPCPMCPAGTLGPHCLPYVSASCVAPRTYAPQYSPGGTVASLPCLLCPPLQAMRMAMPVTSDPCASVCQPDTYEGPGACVPCHNLPVPVGAPYLGYRSLWNATPGSRWWPEAYDPPHLPPRSYGVEERAGRCWPCPVWSLSRASDSLDPCPSSSQMASSVWTIPNNEPQRRRLMESCTTAYTLDRRRIEWCAPLSRSVVAAVPTTELTCPSGWVVENAMHLRPRCVACPAGTIQTETQCRLCPLRTPVSEVGSTQCQRHAAIRPPTMCVARAQAQPFESQICGCVPGTFLDASKNHTCQRCTQGKVSHTLSNAPCTPPAHGGLVAASIA